DVTDTTLHRDLPRVGVREPLRGQLCGADLQRERVRSDRVRLGERERRAARAGRQLERLDPKTAQLDVRLRRTERQLEVERDVRAELQVERARLQLAAADLSALHTDLETTVAVAGHRLERGCVVTHASLVQLIARSGCYGQLSGAVLELDRQPLLARSATAERHCLPVLTRRAIRVRGDRFVRPAAAREDRNGARERERAAAVKHASPPSTAPPQRTDPTSPA